MSTEIRCDCGNFFQADDGLAGGWTNCPRCGHAVEVPGLRDPLWQVVKGGAVVVLVGATAVAWTVGGAAAALLTALGVAGLVWLISRAL